MRRGGFLRIAILDTDEGAFRGSLLDNSGHAVTGGNLLIEPSAEVFARPEEEGFLRNLGIVRLREKI